MPRAMVRIFLSTKFLREYKKIPREIQEISEVKEEIFRQNPFDSRLKTHKLHGRLDGFLACSLTYSYRIIFKIVDEKTVHFYSIGNHDIYE